MFTFAEYLEDFAPLPLKEKGYKLINQTAKEAFPADSPIHKLIEDNLVKIKSGKRDLYF